VFSYLNNSDFLYSPSLGGKGQWDRFLLVHRREHRQDILQRHIALDDVGRADD
jgi:hypothetical protein